MGVCNAMSVYLRWPWPAYILKNLESMYTCIYLQISLRERVHMGGGGWL